MTKPVTLRITDEIFTALQSAADKHDISISAIIRECITHTLQISEKQKGITAYRPRYKYSRKMKLKG